MRPGNKALKEIRRYQKSVDFLIPRSAFGRLVRSVVQEFAEGFRIRKLAMECLQTAGEQHITDLFTAAHLITISSGRKQLRASDIRLAAELKEIPKRLSSHQRFLDAASAAADAADAAADETDHDAAASVSAAAADDDADETDAAAAAETDAAADDDADEPDAAADAANENDAENENADADDDDDDPM
jgi:histone H3